MRQQTTKAKKVRIPLDTISEKPLRGRPPGIRPVEIRGRADHYRFILAQVWGRLWPLLANVRTEEEVTKAFQEGANPYAQEFVPGESHLILKVLSAPKFPKRREAQVNFLADSLAGLGRITPRYSRDVCEQQRAKEARTHHIIRYEVWVECSCGYKGRSHNHACRKCGAEIGFEFASMFTH